MCKLSKALRSRAKLEKVYADYSRKISTAQDRKNLTLAFRILQNFNQRFNVKFQKVAV